MVITQCVHETESNQALLIHRFRFFFFMNDHVGIRVLQFRVIRKSMERCEDNINNLSKDKIMLLRSWHATVHSEAFHQTHDVHMCDREQAIHSY